MTPEVRELDEADKALLYPPFLERVNSVLMECNIVGAVYVPVEGLVVFGEQAKRYFTGRTGPGEIQDEEQPGYSPFQYGLAVRVLRRLPENGHTVESNEAQDYELLGEQVEAAGLVWGGRLPKPQRGRIQWPSFTESGQLAQLKRMYRAEVPMTEYLQAVWDYVTANSDTLPNPFPPKGAA